MVVHAHSLVMEQIPGRRAHMLSHCKITRSGKLSEGTDCTTLRAGSILNQAQDGTKGVITLHDMP